MGTSDKSQRDHPSNAMSAQDRRLVARERKHRFKVGGQVLEAVVASRWAGRLSQARFIPDNKSKTISKISFEVIPLARVQTPPVGKHDWSAIFWPIEFNLQLGPVRSTEALL